MLYPRWKMLSSVLARRCWVQSIVLSGRARFAHGVASRPMLDAYNDLVGQNGLNGNDSQFRVVDELDKLVGRIYRFANARQSVGGAQLHTSSTTSSGADVLQPFADVRAVGAVPKGLYVWGPVGTGKTMLMDLLYTTITKQASKRGQRLPARRVHFHAFMLEVHRRIHEWKKASLAQHGRCTHIDVRPERDAIVHVARAIASESWLLCFDEFQVTDIADAMILSRVFKVLWSNGVVVVATSNRPPSDLYENGLNRHYFLPFIASLEAHTKVVHLDSGLDYRTHGAQAAHGAYLTGTAAEVEAQLLAAVNDQRSKHGLPAVNDLQELEHLPVTTLTVMMGRTLPVRMLAPRTAVASFKELCARPVAAADYLALVDAVDTLILTDIPVLRPHRHNEARRFITLVDHLYEAGTSVVITAAGPLASIFDPLVGMKGRALPRANPAGVRYVGSGMTANGGVGLKNTADSNSNSNYGGNAQPEAATVPPLPQDSVITRGRPYAAGGAGTACADPAGSAREDDTSARPRPTAGLLGPGPEVDPNVVSNAGAAMVFSSGNDSHVSNEGLVSNDPAESSEVQLEVEEDEAGLLTGDSTKGSSPINTAPTVQPTYRPGAASVVSSAAEVSALGELTFACRRALSRLTEMTSTKRAGVGRGGPKMQ